MKVPKYILKALERREKAAEVFNDTDLTVSLWLDKNGIECEMEDYHGGVESIVNPKDSKRRILEAIKNA